jgi:hypothetical protein
MPSAWHYFNKNTNRQTTLENDNNQKSSRNIVLNERKEQQTDSKKI